MEVNDGNQETNLAHREAQARAEELAGKLKVMQFELMSARVEAERAQKQANELARKIEEQKRLVAMIGSLQRKLRIARGEELPVPESVTSICYQHRQAVQESEPSVGELERALNSARAGVQSLAGLEEELLLAQAKEKSARERLDGLTRKLDGEENALADEHHEKRYADHGQHHQQ